MKSLAVPIPPGHPVSLDAIDPDDKGPFDSKADPEVALRLDRWLLRLCDLQELLYAEQRRAVLVVLQAMDTAGKDGALRKVAGPLDSRGVQVASFKAPHSEELAHDYLWRVHARAPRRGDITFFNRSHYEDVLAARVFQLVDKSVWKRRYEHINAWERMLVDEGTTVVKIYLHISRQEQKRRLQERLDDADKRWKFDPGDLKARARWDDFRAAYEEAFARTSTEHAPWHIVPANRKWYRDLAVAQLLCETLERMAPRPPRVDLDPSAIVIPD
jgi:PPK2 family polyphosphate:nucleotide phosphotransferase